MIMDHGITIVVHLILCHNISPFTHLYVIDEIFVKRYYYFCMMSLDSHFTSSTMVRLINCQVIPYVKLLNNFPTKRCTTPRKTITFCSHTMSLPLIHALTTFFNFFHVHVDLQLIPHYMFNLKFGH